jgi:hypothetical protein
MVCSVGGELKQLDDRALICVRVLPPTAGLLLQLGLTASSDKISFLLTLRN